MGEAVLGYDPDAGELILGQHQDAGGRWVEALYRGDDVFVTRPTEVDRAVFGCAEGDLVMVVWRNATAATERYRLGPDVSFHCARIEDAQRTDEILREAAAGRRIDPDKDEHHHAPGTGRVQPAAPARPQPTRAS